MNLREILRVVRKRWTMLVAVLALCVAGGVVLTVLTPKEYSSTAQLFVSTAGSDDTTASQLAQGNTFTQARVQSYVSVADSPRVTDVVADKVAADSGLGFTITSKQLKGEISADAPSGKVLINIHVTNRSPQRAQVLANAVADQFVYVVSDLEKTGSESLVKLTKTQDAQIPATPVTPKPLLNIGLAVLVGLILGGGLAFIRELLDNTVKSPEDLALTSKTPVLAVVPWDKRTGEQAISFRADPHGQRAEAFRQLRTNLQFIDVDNPPRIIAVTSALPGEGKTHTALNLAAALAEAGQRVCLVEADLRKPTLANILGLVGDVGLTTTLIGGAPVEDVLQNAGHNLAVMTSGPVPPNPSELLLSEQCLRTLRYIADSVDIVVIDTAPLLLVADGSDVAALADATLLTVRAGKTTHEQIRRAGEQLNNVGVRAVGTILSMNRARASGGYSYYYADYRPARQGHRNREDEAPLEIVAGSEPEASESVDVVKI